MEYNGMIPLGLRLDISFATGFVLETGFYCVYTCLFFAAFPGMTRARRLEDPRSARSAWVFLIFSIVMYLVATTHLIFVGFRFYKSTFFNTDINSAILYLQDPNNWEFLGLTILLCIQTWLGDALVIYRCYFVWDNNLWLIAVPGCLLLGCIGINIFVFYWTRNPSIIALASGRKLLESIYPLIFVQNFMTTSLIVVKIFLQHRASKRAGLVDVGSKLSLIHIIRIVIESAGIYTIQSFVLNILFFRNDNFQQAVQHTIVPSIGITFVLIALRIEASRNHNAKSDLGIRSSMIPQWLRESDRDVDFQDPQERSSLPLEGGTDVSEQKEAYDGGAQDIDLDLEFSANSVTQPEAAANTLLSPRNRSTSLSDQSTMTPVGLRLDISVATGFLVETGLYSFPGMTRARRLEDSRSARSAWVFLIFSIVMYLVATTHLIFAGFRFYKSTFSDVHPNSAIAYLRNPNHWEFLVIIILPCIQTWLGDALVIYRCYIVWDNNLWLIAVPTCLLLNYIGVNIYVFYRTHNPSIIASVRNSRLFESVYVLAFVQSFMTTSLIVLKIFLQHRASKKAGVVDVGSNLSLIRIVRIVIESAGIYTIQVLVLTILFFRGDTIQYAVQHTIVPSIGITFLLLAIRIEASRNHNTITKSDLGIRDSMMPQWLRESDSEIASQDPQEGSSLPLEDGTDMSDQKETFGTRGAQSIDQDLRFSANSTTRPTAPTNTLLS
ncbi:hypothetical protein D9619_000320 [Psilocybe cf. subviscida]|uniref:Uncharacterized protein n=1 Tax=Psilocybe cf. subviscida TaxID=2480587 RepID=A0A8H5F340_9AGAR|nr:hypothetical protein D9619_000320 [Psilocybe cf. subviscida]